MKIENLPKQRGGYIFLIDKIYRAIKKLKDQPQTQETDLGKMLKANALNFAICNFRSSFDAIFGFRLKSNSLYTTLNTTPDDVLASFVEKHISPLCAFMKVRAKKIVFI